MFETVDNSNTYTDKDQTFQQEVAQLGLSSQLINKHGDNQKPTTTAGSDEFLFPRKRQQSLCDAIKLRQGGTRVGNFMLAYTT